MLKDFLFQIVESINIDASEYFETMKLYKGMLIIEIINGYPTDLSNKIEYFIDNKKSIIKMGKISYKKFNSKFELKKMTDTYNSLFKF